jgi:hypothetical protein
MASSSRRALRPARPQHRLAQPLQPEDQQQTADDQAQTLQRNSCHGGAEDRHEDGQQRHAPDHPGDSRAPVAARSGGEHDRQGLDRLDRTRQEHRHEQGASALTPITFLGLVRRYPSDRSAKLIREVDHDHEV